MGTGVTWASSIGGVGQKQADPLKRLVQSEEFLSSGLCERPHLKIKCYFQSLGSALLKHWISIKWDVFENAGQADFL